MTIEAVCYLRVSTIDQVEQFSLEAQKYELEKYASQNNLNIKKFYIDSGISGKSMTTRQALQDLVRDSDKGLFQEVLVWKISRVARNMKDILTVIKDLKQNGVELVSVSENLDTKSSQGAFTIQMLGSIAELEVSVINENSKLGIHQSMRNGYYAGAPVTGYDIIPRELCKKQKLDANLKINKEAHTVKHIFNMYENGSGYKQIVNYLNKNGYKTKRWKSFSIVTIKQILERRLYTGYMESKINSKIEIIKGSYEPIVSKQQWEKVQAMIKGKAESIQEKHHGRHNFILNRLIVCSKCGKHLTGKVQRRKNKNGEVRDHNYYICSSYVNKGSSGCSAESITAEKIEKEVKGYIQKIVNNPNIINDVQEKVNSKDSVFKDSMKNLNHIISLEDIAVKKRNLLMLQFEEDKISPEEFSSKIKEAKIEQEELKNKKQEVQNYLKEHTKPQIPVAVIQDAFKDISKLISKGSSEDMQELLQLIISKITVDESKNLKDIDLKISNQKITMQAQEEQYHESSYRRQSV